MAKNTHIKHFSKQRQQDLFLLLVEALTGVKKTDAAKLLRDLLSEQEASMLARRLKIALLLEKGLSYKQIRQDIPVSDGTIAKIQLWLNTYGDGFRLVIPKINKNIPSQEKKEIGGWRQLKKRYPIYFWPEILLKEVVSSANKKERQKLISIVNELRDKTPLTKQLQQILSKNSNTM